MCHTCRRLLLVLAVAMVAHGADRAWELSDTRILVCAGYWADMTGMPVLERLERAGAEVRRIRRAELNWGTASRFHAIIYVFDQAAGADAPDAVLRRYVEAGGGVLFFPTQFEATDDINATLAPFGATALTEHLRDPANTFTSPAGFYRLPYAWTDRIATDSPVATGVAGIWYGVGDQGEFRTRAVTVDDTWQVVVRGMATARSLRIEGFQFQGHAVPEEEMQKGTYASDPPIVATRTFRAGAVALTGLNAVEVLYGQGLPHYGEVAWSAGDGLRRSDLGRLYENIVSWLADHGRRANGIGEGELAAAPVPEIAIDGRAGGPCERPIKGVIGLHSTLSDGRATPEQLIAAAREQGLQWVVFTEKLEDIAAGEWKRREIDSGMLASAGETKETFSPDKWEELRAACRAAATADFVALPGIDYADNTGARWVVFGDFDWPPEKVFSADRQRIVDPWIMFAIGTLPVGPYDVGHSPLRPWDYSMYNHWAVRTVLGGKVVDDALDSYLYLQGIQDDPLPMAVDMVRDAGELAAAAQRTCNYVSIERAGDLTTAFLRRLHYFASWRGFISDGPVVHEWSAVNPCRSTNGQWFVAGSERYHVRLTASATAPITDIRIYDGPRLFRRFRPNTPEATVDIDIPHDQQRNLVAVVTDADGKRAVTGGFFIRDLLNFRFMCADRGNSICDAVISDSAGFYLTGPSAPYQRKMDTGGIFPGYGLRPWRITPPGVDGGMRPIAMSIAPPLFYRYTLDPQQPKMWPKMETRMGIPLCSRDGILQEDVVTGWFAEKTSAWEPKLVPRDMPGVQLSYRYLDVTPRDGDMGVILLEGRMVFTAPAEIATKDLAIWSQAVNSTPGEADHYALVTPERTVFGTHRTTPLYVEAAMAPGSYAMVFPAQLGSSGVVALDDGYRVSLSDGSRTYLAVHIEQPPRQVAAGDELRYRLLLLRGRQDERADNMAWEAFVEKLGLRGAPAYTVTDIRAGSVAGTRFSLDLAPTDGGFAGTVGYADLPVRLLVRVADMNPNWTFAWFDLDRREWYPSAVDPVTGQGFFSLDLRRGKHRLFAGHPVLADNAEVRILAMADLPRQVEAAVNNIGDTPIETILRLHPALGAAAPVPCRIPPGGTHMVTFPLAP